MVIDKVEDILQVICSRQRMREPEKHREFILAIFYLFSRLFAFSDIAYNTACTYNLTVFDNHSGLDLDKSEASIRAHDLADDYFRRGRFSSRYCTHHQVSQA